MDAALRAALIGFLSLTVFLVAAKFHGRAVRLFREYAGYLTIDFRRVNPPFVEALWRRDRIRFWTIAGSATVAGILLIIAGRVDSVLPAWTPTLRPLAVGALLLVVWPMTAGFLLEGLWIAAEAHQHALRVAPPAASPATHPAWRNNARRGTLLLGVALVGLILAILLAHRLP